MSALETARETLVALGAASYESADARAATLDVGLDEVYAWVLRTWSPEVTELDRVLLAYLETAIHFDGLEASRCIRYRSGEPARHAPIMKELKAAGYVEVTEEGECWTERIGSLMRQEHYWNGLGQTYEEAFQLEVERAWNAAPGWIRREFFTLGPLEPGLRVGQ